MPIKPKPSNAPTKKDASVYANMDKASRRTVRKKVFRKDHITRYIDEFGVKHLFSNIGSLVNKEIAQIRHPSNGTPILVTVAASLRWKRSGFPKRWYYEVSHTCGLPFCLIHTRWELPWHNTWRDGCHKYKRYIKCPHKPRCLRQPNLERARAALHEGIAKRKNDKAAAMTPAKLTKAERNRLSYATNKEARQKRSRNNQRAKRGTKPENYRVA